MVKLAALDQPQHHHLTSLIGSLAHKHHQKTALWATFVHENIIQFFTCHNTQFDFHVSQIHKTILLFPQFSTIFSRTFQIPTRNTVFHLARPLVGVVSFFIVPPNTHHPRHFRRGQVFFAIATTAASHTGQYRKRESTLDFYQSSKHIIGPLPETTNRNQTKRSRVPVRGTLNDSPRRYSATKMVQKKENIGRRRRPRRPAL